jgi:hypothetical protein
MIREAGEPIAPLPGQIAFQFMAEPRAVAERFRLVSRQAERRKSPRGGRKKRGRITGKTRVMTML